MEQDTLLIVEDSPFVNNTLFELFTQKEHLCLQAFSLKEALDILKKERVDFIILDLHLPDGSDSELIVAIQAACHAKIIILTSENDIQIRDMIFRYGIVDYFIKDDSFHINVQNIDKLMRQIPFNKEYPILCIDDSKLVHKQIELLLEPRNFPLVSALSAREAQEQLKKYPNIALIILDMELPDLHGSRLLKQFKLKEAYRDIPIIVLSGTISPDIVSSVIKAGANDYIEKPFMQEAFLLKVNRLVEQRKKELQLKEYNRFLQKKVDKAVKEREAQQVQMLHQSRLAQMGEMIQMIAHQWRQPLASITAITSNIHMKNSLQTLSSEELERYLSNIDHNTIHLSKTIDNFRNFFQTNNSAIKSSLKEIIKDVLAIVEITLKQKNIVLDLKINSQKSFHTFPNELKQVVLNLIKNSEDALLQTKKADPKIGIELYEEKDYFVIKVSDNGGGIDSNIINDIFLPYTSTKTNTNGTGLGLYMSKIIIEDHCKGSLKVFNEKEGAVFICKVKDLKERDKQPLKAD